jgi:hypothetical protein
MKKLGILAIVVAIAALFAACSALMPKTSIDDCINNFMSDVNGNQGAIYNNLDPAAAKYSEAKAASYWNVYFGSGPYSLSNQYTVGSTVTANISGGAYPSAPITFTMSTDSSGNAVISSIYITGPGLIFN